MSFRNGQASCSPTEGPFPWEPLLPSRAVASAVTAAVPAAIAVTLSANPGPVVTVAAPKGAGVPRTTPHVHSDWPSQMHHAAHI